MYVYADAAAAAAARFVCDIMCLINENLNKLWEKEKIKLRNFSLRRGCGQLLQEKLIFIF